MTKFYFNRTENCLKKFLADQRISGIWSDQPNGVKMLRCGRQVQIHWSSTKSSLWVSGRADAKCKMEQRLAIALPDADSDVDHDYPDFDWVD